MNKFDYNPLTSHPDFIVSIYWKFMVILGDGDKQIFGTVFLLFWLIGSCP